MSAQHIWKIKATLTPEDWKLFSVYMTLAPADRAKANQENIPHPGSLEMRFGTEKSSVPTEELPGLVDPTVWESAVRLLIGDPWGVPVFTIEDSTGNLIYSTVPQEPVKEEEPKPDPEVDESKLRVKILAHRGVLVIHTLNPESDDNFVPAGGSKIGCVLIDTEKLLGISKEAWDLIDTMTVGRDDLGDLSFWMTNDGRGCAGWLGPPKRLMSPDRGELDRNGPLRVPHILIANEIDPEERVAIDAGLDGEI